MKLLTVKDVAEMLQINERTVYDRAKDLGGFFPAGIKTLRFDEADLHDILERSKKGALALQVPVSGSALLRKGVRNAQGIGFSGSGSQKARQGEKTASRFNSGRI